MEVFLQALVNGILLGGFYSLMGMGQNIIFGVMNIVNFCHGEMLMVGMYITYVLYTYFGVDPYVALPIVAVLMFGLGALIQSTLITPSLKTKSFTNLLFLTVGLGLPPPTALWSSLVPPIIRSLPLIRRPISRLARSPLRRRVWSAS